MKDEHAGWEEQLKAAPFAQSQFNEELRKNVRRRITSDARARRYGWPVALVCAVAVLGMGVFYAAGMAGWLPVKEAERQPRGAYYKDGELLLQVYPDPELKAGREFGYIFSFTEPFANLAGKVLEIQAVHDATNQTVAVTPPTVSVIENPSSGYATLKRHTVSFALPLGGLWRFEVSLDGAPYARVELDVAEPDWELSPSFRTENYEMTGIEGKVGFIDAGFIAGQPNKYMWHFWGETFKHGGELEVLAVKQGTTEMIPVLQGRNLGGANNGADAHLPSSMSLPEAGVWRLLPFVNGRLVESIVVNVREQ
ncbi:DUF4871 domain-containing protein [Paenibacillus sp. LHD-117]|uniref:DUF4871 domain-containing protein n=1 Tax=Paenibacillus sp. LHD-117 TaxID=3071412 RepID=UPI0027E0DA85|nr:DUF4871 domain-containing protein [Paenibacillus sp. LHD-117]MDQ6420005.1 DUF4871 domain-containing protein [Paenibacillus sp. LHD-117]